MKDLPQINPRVYFIIYCFCYFCFGLLLGTFGAIIPYLAKERNVPETQFSYMFIVRTVGSLATYLILRYIQKNTKNTEHKILVFAGLLTFVFTIIFEHWRSDVGIGLCMGVFGGGQFLTFTSTSIGIFILYHETAGNKIVLTNALFGIGALVSPLVIKVFEINAFYVLSVTFLIQSVLCFIYPTPTLHQQKIIKSSTANQGHFLQASFKLEVMIAIGLFFIGGMEMIVNGWISSYAVIRANMTKSEATIFVTLFWALSTIGRVILVSLDSKNSTKLKALIHALVACSILCILIHHLEAYKLATIFGALGFGISCSGVFPLVLSISTEFNIKMRPEQISNLLIAPIISSGFNSTITGMLMHHNIGALFYSLLVSSLALWADSVLFFREMEQPQTTEQVKPVEQELLSFENY